MIKHAVWLVLLILCTKGGAWADDLEIFGGQLVNIPPNVLIIFDTSGSMAYCTDPSSNSTCSNVSDRRINVAKTAINQLLDNTQNVNFGLMAFNGSNGGKLLEPCGTTTATLKTAVSGLSASGFTPLAETLAEAGLYFAGQRSWFAESNYGNKSWYQNSKYVSPVQEDCQKNYIVLMTDGEPTQDDDSKLATSLYIKNTVIGDYDGDKAGVTCTDGGGWWGGGDTYNDELCELQPDGSYDVYSSQGSDYLDDVAYYLSNKKVFYNSLTTLNTGTDDETDVTPIRTFTIGFSSPGAVTSLLTNAASNGGGDYYSATTSSALQDAFKEILENVLDTNAIYATPSIPRNPENQVESGDKTYLAFFKPQPDGRWLGNLKAYGLKDNALMDSRSTIATPLTATDADGLIKVTARSYWDVDNANDGLEVAKGGAGEVLTGRITDNGVSDRKVYTYTDVDAVNFLSQGGSFYRLSQQQNQFKTTNVQGLDTLLEGIYSSATPSETIVADTLISKVVNGTTVTFDDGTPTKWYLGDIIHSEPLVANFSADCNGDSNPDDDYVFVGANDGMLHAFCADTGMEMWAFIPPSQLGRLNLLGNGEHHYYVDGSPVIAEVAVPNTNPVAFQKVLIFGEGRGGQRYIALDFTTSDNPTNPHWRYQVHEDVLAYNEAVLGQSWAKPQFKKVRDVDDITGVKTLYDVFLLAGGYDPRYETSTFPSSVPQSPEIQGRALYTIDASSGVVVGLNVNGGEWTAMQHSIVDVTGFDAEGRGYMDRVYAGDLGGNMLAASYNSGTDTWEKLALLALPDNLSFKDSLGNTVNDTNGNPITGAIGKKIMTRPEVTLEADGECVYFGTGDREHLIGESVTDAFYVICHDWEKQIDLVTNQPVFQDGQYLYEPIFPADTNNDGSIDGSDSLTDVLVDVTDNLVQADASQKATIETRLKNNAGWYLRMEHPGEKITSSPKIIDGKIFFTTFTPGQDSQQNQDPCATSYDLGVSRLYAIDYRTGASVLEFDDTTGLTKADRSTIIGTSVAYDPVLTTSGLKTTLLYGSGGKFKAKDVSLKTILKQYYWRQVK